MSSPADYLGRTRLRDVQEEGHVVVLRNGSCWEIPDPEDRARVERWGGAEVWVAPDKFGEGDFILSTGERGDAVKAKFAGTE
jgi:hypothetical protein